MKNLLSPNKISSNQSFSNFFRKTVDFTRFLPNKCESKFPTVWKCRKFTPASKLFREINYLVTSLKKVKTLLSRNFCQKSAVQCDSKFPHFLHWCLTKQTKNISSNQFSNTVNGRCFHEIFVKCVENKLTKFL